MCFDYLCCLFYTRHEDIEFSHQNDFCKAMDIIIQNEPNLIIDHSEYGIIKFSKEWREWIEKISPELREWMKRYTPLDIRDKMGNDCDIYQTIFITNIPVKYHSQFLINIQKEYNNTYGTFIA